MREAVIVVVRFSASFWDVWAELAAGLGTEIRALAPGDFSAVPRTGAVVLAAPGAEEAALTWLEGHEIPAGAAVLVVGSDPGRRTAARVVSRGAADYFALPDDVELLRNALALALARCGQVRRGDVGDCANRSTAFDRFAGSSPVILTVLERAARFARHASGTALIAGEVGTGKHLLARAIHQAGPRRDAPFVPVNCCASWGGLIESELFGDGLGVLRDGEVPTPGLFEVASGGTVFLEEVGALPADIQGKLCRVLESRELRRVGSTKRRQVDVRVIAATSEDLDEAVRRGRFRQDLHSFLGVVTLALPPLRQRGDDVVTIAERLLESLARHHRMPAPALRQDARDALAGHPWPGNVRELKDALERALLLSPPGRLDVTELARLNGGGTYAAKGLPFPAPLDTIVRAAAHAMLQTCGGNLSEAARRLGVSRRRLRGLVQPAHSGPVPEVAGAN